LVVIYRYIIKGRENNTSALYYYKLNTDYDYYGVADMQCLFYLEKILEMECDKNEGFYV
jgi:hypothetical protein